MAQQFDADFVIYRLEEAGRTLLALPSKGCLPAGFGNGWPSVVHSAVEAYGWQPADQPRVAVPSPAAISRMDEAWGWVNWVRPKGMHETDYRESFAHRQIVLLRAMVSPVTERHLYSWRRIGGMKGWDYRAVQRWHAQGIDDVVCGINLAARSGKNMLHRINVHTAA